MNANDRSRPSTADFYGQAGLALMDERNYPSAIVHHLEGERALLRKIVPQKGYTAAIEVGCADGNVHLNTFRELRVDYLGIDIVPQFVAALNVRIEATPGPPRTRACLLDACRLSQLRAELPEHKVLVVFPFNSFGNLEDPRAALSEVHAAGFDLLILTYRTDPASNLTRYEYYERCKLKDIRQAKDTRGVIFHSGDGFRSYAYHRHWLLKNLRGHTFACVTEDFGLLGRFFWGWPGGT